MKNVLIVIINLLIFSFIIGCGVVTKSPEVTSFNVNVVNKVVTDDEVIVDVVIKESLVNNEALNEIANQVVSDVYTSHFNDWKTIQLDITINFYLEADYVNKKLTFGNIIYELNASLDHPGLSIKSNNLKG